MWNMDGTIQVTYADGGNYNVSEHIYIIACTIKIQPEPKPLLYIR